MTSGNLRHALKGLALGAGVTVAVCGLAGAVALIAINSAPEPTQAQSRVVPSTSVGTRGMSASERERAFKAHMEEATSMSGSVALEYGWFVCTGVFVVGYSVDGAEQALTGVMSLEEIGETATSALTLLCPNGERRGW